MSSNTTAAATQIPQKTLVHIAVVILMLAFVLGFPGNLFVVWSVCCRVKNRSLTCLLVLNLALADALVLLGAPFFLRYLLAGRGWEFGSAACKLIHYLSSVNMYVSIYLIALMSADRCLAVRLPFLAHRLRTKRTLLGVLLAVWVLAFLLSLPMPFYRSKKLITFKPNVTAPVCTQDHGDNLAHPVFQYVFETVMGFLVPFVFIVSCYAVVVQRLRSAMFQKKGQSSRLILLIVAAFALFWLPYHLVNVIEVYSLVVDSKDAGRAARQARPIVTPFAYFSSAVNPILYVFAGSSHIRQAGLGFMGKMFEATNSETRSTNSMSRTRSSRGGSTALPGAREESSPLRALSGKLSWALQRGSRDEAAPSGGTDGHFHSELHSLAGLGQE